MAPARVGEDADGSMALMPFRGRRDELIDDGG